MASSERRMGWTALVGLGLNVWLCGHAGGRAAEPGAAERHPQQLPLRLHVELLQRKAGRHRGAAMPAAQCRQALAGMPERGQRREPAARSAATGDDRSGGSARRPAGATRCPLPTPGARCCPGSRRGRATKRAGPCATGAGPRSDGAGRCRSIGSSATDSATAGGASVNPANRISCRAAEACSPAEPTRSTACSAIPRSSRRTASARSRRLAAGACRTPAVATAAPAAAPTLASAPSPEQQSAIKVTCRGDFMANCRGVTPGGPEALACLQRNAARLSPDCKTSLAAIADAAPAPATDAAPAAAAPAARPGPVGPLRRALRERMMDQ